MPLLMIASDPVSRSIVHAGTSVLKLYSLIPAVVPTSSLLSLAVYEKYGAGKASEIRSRVVCQV